MWETAGDLRGPIFEKEKEKVEGGGEGEMMRIELYKQYGYAELDEKMRMLRPDGGKEKSREVEFLFGELGERLVKLRVIEEWEAESRSAFGPLRNTLMQLGRNQPDNSKKWPGSTPNPNPSSPTRHSSPAAEIAPATTLPRRTSLSFLHLTPRLPPLIRRRHTAPLLQPPRTLEGVASPTLAVSEDSPLLVNR
ncbi:hypothetical protein Droror1_Dr00019448 [Drosera rotundifolia]